MIDERDIANAYLKFLEDRFKNKIDPDKYYLSYSGGKDSHLLLWFIKKWLKEERITIVGVNTGFEIPEIRNRIIKNSDVVLHPVMHRREIKSGLAFHALPNNMMNLLTDTKKAAGQKTQWITSWETIRNIN